MSFTVDLLTGMAAHLGAGGIADPVFFKALPTTPDRCIAITAYAATDDPSIPLTAIRVQFWFRGMVNDSLDVDHLGDAVFTIIQGMKDTQFGSAHVALARRVSSIQLGSDANKRTERSDNYTFDVDVPPTALRDW